MFDSYCIPNDPNRVPGCRFSSVAEIKTFVINFLHRLGLTESDLSQKGEGGKLSRYIKGVNVAAVRMALCYYIDINSAGLGITLKRKAELAGYSMDHSAVKHVQKKAAGYLKTNDNIFAEVWNMVCSA